MASALPPSNLPGEEGPAALNCFSDQDKATYPSPSKGLFAQRVLQFGPQWLKTRQKLRKLRASQAFLGLFAFPWPLVAKGEHLLFLRGNCARPGVSWPLWLVTQHISGSRTDFLKGQKETPGRDLCHL